MLRVTEKKYDPYVTELLSCMLTLCWILVTAGLTQLYRGKNHTPSFEHCLEISPVNTLAIQNTTVHFLCHFKYLAFTSTKRSEVRMVGHHHCYIFTLTFSALQAKTISCANSVQPDETVTSHLIRIYTVCHSVFHFWMQTLFATVYMS